MARPEVRVSEGDQHEAANVSSQHNAHDLSSDNSLATIIRLSVC